MRQAEVLIRAFGISIERAALRTASHRLKLILKITKLTVFAHVKLTPRHFKFLRTSDVMLQQPDAKQNPQRHRQIDHQGCGQRDFNHCKPLKDNSKCNGNFNYAAINKRGRLPTK